MTVLSHRVARIAATVLFTSLIWVATSKDLRSKDAITSHRSNAHPDLSVSLPSCASNNIVFATSSFLYQCKAGLDEDDDHRDTRRIDVSKVNVVSNIQRGGGFSSWIPAGYNPFGYQITELGLKFLEFDGSLDSDVGRFLASVKSRKRFEAIKSQWLEILRVSKTGQSMRIYKSLDDMIKFCIAANLLD